MKKVFCILSLILINHLFIFSQQDSIIIRNNGSVLMEMLSSDKGLLTPRVTTSQRVNNIINPESGLLVFDTDLDLFCFYNGTLWICGWDSSISSSGNCITLDEAYDCDTMGAGRIINVDKGPVYLTNASSVNTLILEADKNGTGAVGSFKNNNFGFINETSVLLAQDTNAIKANIHLGTIAGDAISSETFGTGRAGHFKITNTNSNNDALEAQTLGLRHGIVGYTGLKTLINGDYNFNGLQSSGTVGLSNVTNQKRRGSSGVSLTSDGVWGRSFAGGSGYNTFANIDSLIAGVHGSMKSLQSANESKDYFGVFGITTNNGQGVLGVGGGAANGVKGHGVMGVSAWSVNTNSTNAGVWGITREGLDWPTLRTRFPLEEINHNKVQVGVLGQSNNFPAVWGESLNKIGVVGSTKTRLGAADLIDIQAGLYAIADSTGSGAIGKSNSNLLDDAGVKAIGKADRDKASSLEIHDGAIRVTKDVAANTPADKVTIPITWTAIDACNENCNGQCNHTHRIGYWGEVIIPNMYCDPDRSIILLTPQFVGPGFVANVNSLMPGSFKVNISFYLPQAHCQGQNLPNPITFHYLIINK